MRRPVTQLQKWSSWWPTAPFTPVMGSGAILLPRLNVTQNLKQHIVYYVSNIHFSKLIFTLHLETHLLVDNDRSEIHIKTSLYCMNLLRDRKRQKGRW